jgi:hypothetical protein
MLISLAPIRRAAAGSLLLLAAAACDDPATMAKEVVGAKGNCTEDSLRVSSEACVQMFQTYAEMATKAIHGYIGGMKALDQALKRMPPANFDTAGLGHAFTPALDSAGAALATRPGGTGAPGAPSFSRSAAGTVRSYPTDAYGQDYEASQWSDGAPDDWGDPYSPYDPYGRSDPYGPADGDPYARPGAYAPTGPYGAGAPYPYGSAPYGPASGYGSDARYPRDPRGGYEYEVPDHPARPTSPPGVLRPPSERLDRPWVPQRSARPVDPRYPAARGYPADSTDAARRR